MITLGDFTGLLLSDFLQARRQADAYSTAISEEYHVNPLLKGMPVPRYIIDEAEIEVPLRIMGVQKSEFREEDKVRLTDKIKRYLPTLLYRNLKNSYYDKEEYRVTQINGIAPGDEPIGMESILHKSEDPGTVKTEVIRLSERPVLKACYKASTASICQKMNEYMATYIKENAVSEMKLLDFTDAFAATLKSVVKQEFSTYQQEEMPFIDKNSLKKLVHIVSNTMFFEFKDIFEESEGVLVGVETGKLEAQAAPEQLMRMKLKIREQDVDFIVDTDEETGETKRFTTPK